MTPALQQRIEASAYLTRLQSKLALSAEQAPQNLPELLTQICDEINVFDVAAQVAEAEVFLIQQKQRFSYYWSLCELQDVLTQHERGEWQTRFAEVTIEFALKVAWQLVATKHRAISKQLEKVPEGMPGLFIFGMGKLGGNDLNFSSDVDLVAYFDPELLLVPEMLGKSHICHQVLQTVTKLLGQNGRVEFIWRVDWRLRPNASATTLAMSTDAALDYYYYHASPWHRLALMKARVIAGDKQAGSKFMNALTPFIWRQNLDFRALDELAEIKQRINLEHPSLRAERQWREPIGDDVMGFNLKLGTGGIREIEFIANALQLVWGGKQYALRTPNTLEALQELASRQHLNVNLAKQLVTAYQFFRRVENAIQIFDNQQTHLIPIEERSQQNLSLLLGVSDWTAFVTELNEYRHVVSTKFETLFAQHENDEHEEIIWPDKLNPQAQGIVDGWANGFQRYGVSNQIRHRLLPLGKELSEYLNSLDVSDVNAADASSTVQRLDDFFKSLPSGEQYFRLLAESPRLLESIVPPLLYSPPMSKLLKQSPHIIDCYVHAPWDYTRDGFDFAYVLQADQYEIRLERLRRFVNEHLYQLYLRFIKGEMAVLDFQLALTDMAETTLELSLKVVAENMGLDESPITVIGMGKIALRRMSPTSDLDLIFIYDAEQTSLELASRFVSRLQTAISTPMKEGIVYELDTRLRPSGRSGAPTVSVNSFRDHQLQRAHTWEHIALLSSRVVAGNRKLDSAIQQVKHDVVATPRDKDQFLGDVLKMWFRIAEHRIETHPYDVMFNKLRPGGLMQTEYLAACQILQQVRTTDSVEYIDLLTESSASQNAIDDLPEIIQFWRIQQLWERLLGKAKQPLTSIPSQYLEQLLEQSGVSSVEQLVEKKMAYAERIQQGMSHLQQQFGQADDLDKWVEAKVQWQ